MPYETPYPFNSDEKKSLSRLSLIEQCLVVAARIAEKNNRHYLGVKDLEERSAMYKRASAASRVAFPSPGYLWNQS